MTRRTFLTTAGAAAAIAAERGKPAFNVLFLPVDDLRPYLGCYGSPTAITPNIDRLAARGTVFTRAYCQQAICSASRSSLLTGRRPDTTRIYELQTHFRKHLPDVVTLPQHFKQNGWVTTGFGKIYHGTLDDGASWSIPAWKPNGPRWNTPENAAAFEKHQRELKEAGWYWDNRPRGKDGKKLAAKKNPSWEAPDVAGQRAFRRQDRRRRHRGAAHAQGPAFLPRRRLPEAAPALRSAQALLRSLPQHEVHAWRTTPSRRRARRKSRCTIRASCAPTPISPSRARFPTRRRSS